jgi:polysaccharide biosynthesis/export protein
MSKRAAALLFSALLSVAVLFAEDYDIGPLDVLRIGVLGQPEMSGEFSVEADGLLSFPFVGRVKASGMTAPELEKKLTTLLSDGYLKKPQVSVSVKEFKSQRIFVTGEIARPGPYSLRMDRTLLGLLTEIGSLSPNAGHELVVVRPPDAPPPPLLVDAGPEGSAHGDTLPLPTPAEEVTRVKLSELQSGKPEANIVLRAGDTVRIPKAASVYVQGFVARPGPYRYEQGLTVFQALNLAGGVTERGAAGRVKLIRFVDGKKLETKPSPTDVLEPDDSLFVPERFF